MEWNENFTRVNRQLKEQAKQIGELQTLVKLLLWHINEINIRIEGNYTWTEDHMTITEDSTTNDAIPCDCLFPGLVEVGAATVGATPDF